MQIGIVTTWFERGAAYVSRQYQQLLAGRHEVFIYARGGESYAIGDPNWDGPRVTWGKRVDLPILTALDLQDFQAWLQSNRIELVLFNEQRWWEPVLLCNRLGIKTCAYVDYYTRDTVPLFGCYDILLCNTRRHFDVFSRHPQALYVPWGTDTALFRPAQPGPVSRGDVTFFHSGGMNPARKGTDQVLQALPALRGPARLVVHVQRSLRAALPRLTALIDHLETQGRLVCYEQTVPAPGLYHLGDVYVYPARREGIGLTVPEALASGLPVIASDVPPLNEFVDASNGRLVALSRLIEEPDAYYWPQSVASQRSLIDQMQAFVDQREQLPVFKNAARSSAEQRLDWFCNARQLPRQLADLPPLSPEQKRAAEEAAWAYERQRSRRLWLWRGSPRLYSLAQRLRAAARRLRRGDPMPV